MPQFLFQNSKILNFEGRVHTLEPVNTIPGNTNYEASFVVGHP